MKSLLYAKGKEPDKQFAECHPFGRAEHTESCSGPWAFLHWVTFLWHRMMSLCLVTGAHTHTLDVFSSHWKVPPWQISPSTKSIHSDPGAVSRHVLCSRPPQVALCSSQTHLFLTEMGALRELHWSSSLLIYPLSPQCLCLMPSNANHRHLHAPKWKQQVPPGDLLQFRSQCIVVSTETLS